MLSPTVWLARANDALFRTDDAGLSRAKVYPSGGPGSPTRTLGTPFFATAKRGWLLGPGILETTDGGLTWIDRARDSGLIAGQLSGQPGRLV
ncbi:MAG: hypothetical protein H7330_05910 [Hymenobacteraceae bacterium]|nr:hypothetical protein [Hymenobacteraceae bacterium]